MAHSEHLALLEVFCCYAREDQEMLARLKKHLAPLERQGQITIWSDTNLDAGIEWEKELHQHLESADIILLLISPDFMASDYCYSTEMRRAIARHNEGSTVVIPILLRSVLWQNAPFAKLQIIPKDAKPVTSWPDRDDAWHDITMQVNQVVSQLHIKRTQTQASSPAITREHQPTNQAIPPASQDLLAASMQVQPILIPSPPKVENPQIIASPELLCTLTGHTGAIWSVALSPDGLMLASGGVDPDSTVKLWDVQTGRLLRTLIGHSNRVYGVVWSADGRTLASGSLHIINLWNVQTGQRLRTIGGIMGTNSSSSVAFSPDGTMLASDSVDRKIKLWNARTGKRLRTIDAIAARFYSVSFSPDGHTLAGGGSEFSLWDVGTGEHQRTLKGHTRSVNSVAWSTDGQMLASGGDDQTIKLWNAQTGQLLHTLIGHTDVVNSVSLSTDGSTLASGSLDQTIKLWNVQTGQLLRTLSGHADAVKSVSLSADGRTLASGSLDQTIKLWEVKA